MCRVFVVMIAVCTYRLRSQEETAKKLESEKREISDTAQSLQANLEVIIGAFPLITFVLTSNIYLLLCVASGTGKGDD